MHMDFKKELESLLNRHSKDADISTPDFILAKYVENLIEATEGLVKRRDEWLSVYRRKEPFVGMLTGGPASG